jgi:hypothetical protein
MSDNFNIFAAVRKLKDDDVLRLIEAAQEIKKVTSFNCKTGLRSREADVGNQPTATIKRPLQGGKNGFNRRK